MYQWYIHLMIFIWYYQDVFPQQLPNVCFFLSTGFPVDLKNSGTPKNSGFLRILINFMEKWYGTWKKWYASNPLPFFSWKNVTLTKICWKGKFFPWGNVKMVHFSSNETGYIAKFWFKRILKPLKNNKKCLEISWKTWRNLGILTVRKSGSPVPIVLEHLKRNLLMFTM